MANKIRAHRSARVISTWLGFLLCWSSGLAADPVAVELPAGVKPVWDLSKAWRETTPARERISINGLWRWQPAANTGRELPNTAWGYFKVPAPWPGIQDYMQSDYQTLHSHPAWKNAKLSELKSAWYERTISIPSDWSGRRIVLEIEYLNSYAAVYVDGKPAGEVRFPAGEVDLSAVVRPGSTHVLTLYVVAMPLKAVMESYTDTNAARQRQGTVQRRGLCGDVWLMSEPVGERLGETEIDTSFRQKQITFTSRIHGLATGKSYKVRARIMEESRVIEEFTSTEFGAEEITTSHTSFTVQWKDPKLWDIHTPENQYTAELSLLDSEGRTLDNAAPVRFGFREFWIKGRDFYLNGTRLFLSVVPLDNAQVGAALATYAGARESLLRLKSFGINFVYTHNYDCEPGSHLSFAEILRAADDTGMLVALSQPHFSAYEWKSPAADQTNGYSTHASFYARVAGSHPSVVSYSMSHNATGYNEDMNPRMMDGLNNPRDQWASRNAALALRCEAIVRRLDPTRIVYHHASGNLTAIYSVNFYPNFVPIQELDDWFEHWSGTGVKPVVLVEYGAPFGWDWTMYRGWFKGKREFGSAVVPWEYCLAEWNAQFLGDTAYRISDREKRNLRWEAQQFRQRSGWHRWDYPVAVGDERLEEMQPVQEAYTTANWRAFRTWGLSGNSPWEHDRFWKLNENFQPRRRELPVDWENLQRPGFSPDFIDRTYARFDLAYERSNWIASPTAQSLMRNNMPLLAWIAGKPQHLTSKDHIFYPGETVQKQLIVINNSRVTIKGTGAWSCSIGSGTTERRELTIPTGEQVRIPLEIRLPDHLAPGNYGISASFTASTGSAQEDSFAFQVVPRQMTTRLKSKLAVFDPPGETSKWLADQGIKFARVDASADLSDFDVLLIGKKALTVSGAAPSLLQVRTGLKVVVFEQTAEVLEQRLGFRTAEYGLRQVWARVPDSPLLAGLDPEKLRDWRGASTLLPSALDYTLNPRYNGAPTVRWCGLDVPRLWRCGNRGNVASVLIEKPPRGDFLPIIDGGYALEFSPLLEYREGRGMILFCQMDITGRTEPDPVAVTLAGNILRYVDAWQPTPRRKGIYAGDSAGRAWLTECGVKVARIPDEVLSTNHVLIVGPGGGAELDQHAAAREWIKAGGRVLALGLDASEANRFLPAAITTQPGEHIAAWFPCSSAQSLLAGVAPADVHNRDPRTVPLLTAGATIHGNGVLGIANQVVFMQLPPFQLSQTNNPAQLNLRRTFDRTSFALSRILGNLGVAGSTPLLDRFVEPVSAAGASKPVTGRWLTGLYLTQPIEWDDPYRFFRW